MEETPDSGISSRRNFLKQSAVAAAALGFPTVLPRHVLGGPNHVPPSETVLLGMVGVGGQGRHNTEQFLKLDDVRIAAIADPADFWNLDRFYYKSNAGRGPVKALIEEHYQASDRDFALAVYYNFEEMLERHPELDGIVCSTPDHTHAYVSSHALRAGKHVYCEKPLTHNLWENRYIRDLTRETGLATQMGNYGHSSDTIRQVVEYLRAGLIGEVKEAHSWCHASRWNQGLYEFPEVSTQLPTDFDWNLWLGPRDYVAFHEAFAPVTWRDFWRFGTGALGDFGCHDMDAAVWAFDLAEPESVQVYPGGVYDRSWNPDVIPSSEIGYFRFREQGTQKELDLTWYSGFLRPPHNEWLPSNFNYAPRGMMFVGDRGVIQMDSATSAPRIFPAELREAARAVDPVLARSNGHFRDWIDAIKGGPEASANFEYSARLTEIVLLGVLSLRLKGQRIYWDSGNLTAKGMPEADEIIREPIRRGWELA